MKGEFAVSINLISPVEHPMAIQLPLIILILTKEAPIFILLLQLWILNESFVGCEFLLFVNYLFDFIWYYATFKLFHLLLQFNFGA